MLKIKVENQGNNSKNICFGFQATCTNPLIRQKRLQPTVSVGNDRVVLGSVVGFLRMLPLHALKVFAGRHLGDLLENTVEGSGVVESAVECDIQNIPVVIF